MIERTNCIHCIATRQSVCMGEDVLAPNGREFDITIAADHTAPVLACIRQIVLEHYYLPPMTPHSAWIAEVGKQYMAVVTTNGSSGAVLPIAGAQEFVAAPNPLEVHFHYYLNGDPQRISRQIAESGQAERIYES